MKNVAKRRLSSISEVIEGVEVIIEGSFNVEPLINPLVEVSPIPTQFEAENLPSILSKKQDFVSISGASEGGSPNTMDPLGGGGNPPPIPPFLLIDPMVRPRGLPIIVPQGLVSVDIPSNLLKFYGTKDRIRLGTWRGSLSG